ncbi:hypothetical protein [Streptomyces paludis]|uniref:Uncharacterized protein n=1 Tax=Streptomyces paludis TaxID=2282738 RepID=A0A345HWY3_9ACTN|nr:hypothetical protein [Streptomyces paludis]AXG81207.1 hypothetical protein DVK44_29895 [Streptomyces paludis]
MHRTAPAVPRTAAQAAARARALRRGALILLLALAALVGAGLEPGAVARGSAEPPPVSGSRDPSGDGQGEVQQDTTEPEHVTPATVQRAARARVEPPAPLGAYDVPAVPYTERCGRAGAPRLPDSSRRVVLRC